MASLGPPVMKPMRHMSTSVHARLANSNCRLLSPSTAGGSDVAQLSVVEARPLSLAAPRAGRGRPFSRKQCGSLPTAAGTQRGGGGCEASLSDALIAFFPGSLSSPALRLVMSHCTRRMRRRRRRMRAQEEESRDPPDCPLSPSPRSTSLHSYRSHGGNKHLSRAAVVPNSAHPSFPFPRREGRFSL